MLLFILYLLFFLSGPLCLSTKLIADPPAEMNQGQGEVQDLLKKLQGDEMGESGLKGLAKKLTALKESLSKLLGKVTGKADEGSSSSDSSEPSTDASGSGSAGGTASSASIALMINTENLTLSLTEGGPEQKKIENIIQFFIDKAREIKNRTFLNFTHEKLKDGLYKELEVYRYDAFSALVQLAFFSIFFYCIYTGKTITNKALEKLDNVTDKTILLFEDEFEKLPIKQIVAFLPVLISAVERRPAKQDAGDLEKRAHAPEAIKQDITTINNVLASQLVDQNWLTMVHAFVKTLGFLYNSGDAEGKRITQHQARAAIYEAMEKAVREFQIAKVTIQFADKIAPHEDVGIPTRKDTFQLRSLLDTPISWLSSWMWKESANAENASVTKDIKGSDEKTPLHVYAEDINNRLRKYFSAAQDVLAAYDDACVPTKNPRSKKNEYFNLSNFLYYSFLLPHLQMFPSALGNDNQKLSLFVMKCREWMTVAQALDADSKTFDSDNMASVFNVERIKGEKDTSGNDTGIAFDTGSLMDLLEMKADTGIEKIEKQINGFMQSMIDDFFSYTDEQALNVLIEVAEAPNHVLRTAHDERTGGNILHMIISRALYSSEKFFLTKTTISKLQDLMKNTQLLQEKNKFDQTPLSLAFINGLFWIFPDEQKKLIFDYKNRLKQTIFHVLVQNRLLTSSLPDVRDTIISQVTPTNLTNQTVNRPKTFIQGLLVRDINDLLNDPNNKAAILDCLLHKDALEKTPFHYAKEQKQYNVYNKLLALYNHVGGMPKELVGMDLPHDFQDIGDESAMIFRQQLKALVLEEEFKTQKFSRVDVGG